MVSRLTPRRDDRGRDFDAYHLPWAGELAAPRNPRHQIARRGAIASPETQRYEYGYERRRRKTGWGHLG